MSSQYPCLHGYCYNGSKVVDGIYTPINVYEHSIIAHTLNETNPWLQIDLEKSFCISAVKIWNRNMEIAGRRFYNI